MFYTLTPELQKQKGASTESEGKGTERNEVNTEPPLSKGCFVLQENVRARKQQFLVFVSSVSFVELVISFVIVYHRIIL